MGGGVRLFAFPLAVDAEQRIGELDAVIGPDDDVAGGIELPAVELVGRDGQLAVFLCAHDAACDRMLARGKAALAVARVAVCIVRIAA
jgi:ABC-type sugar transport system substrate-binding protein